MLETCLSIFFQLVGVVSILVFGVVGVVVVVVSWLLSSVSMEHSYLWVKGTVYLMQVQVCNAG